MLSLKLWQFIQLSIPVHVLRTNPIRQRISLSWTVKFIHCPPKHNAHNWKGWHLYNNHTISCLQFAWSEFRGSFENELDALVENLVKGPRQMNNSVDVRENVQGPRPHRVKVFLLLRQDSSCPWGRGGCLCIPGQVGDSRLAQIPLKPPDGNWTSNFQRYPCTIKVTLKNEMWTNLDAGKKPV